jgi:L-threonylcarbamoyladenylate synthase
MFRRHLTFLKTNFSGEFEPIYKMQSDREDKIKEAVDIIKSGGTVVYPTETVYGLGADAFSEEAVRKVYKIKGRDFLQPISIAVSSFEMLHTVAYIDSKSLEIITELLPGPVTVLLRKKDVVPDVLTATSEVVGVRFPDNEIANHIIKETGPITATSANVSGRNPPTCIEEVEIKADIIINGGKCKYSMPSTVVDMSREAANEEKAKIKIEIKRRGACYDRVLHVLRGKAAGKGFHGLPVP